MTHNGRTNYETWAAKLWIDNEEGTYNEVTSQAAEAIQLSDSPEYDFANWLESYVEEVMCSDAPTTGLTADLFQSAWQAIDWRDMAESYIEDARNEAADDEA